MKVLLEQLDGEKMEDGNGIFGEFQGSSSGMFGTNLLHSTTESSIMVWEWEGDRRWE